MKRFLTVAGLVLIAVGLMSQTTDYTFMRNLNQTITGTNTFTATQTFNGIVDQADTASDQAPVPSSSGAYTYYALPAGCVAYKKVASGGPQYYQCGAADLTDGTTGTGAIVKAASPTLSGTVTIGSGSGGKLAGLAALGLLPSTYATLIASYPCASGIEGYNASVTDSNTNTWGATVAGSGSFHVKAYCNGTNWVVD